MALYSHNGGYPNPLPKSYLASDGTNYTALDEMSAAKLGALGWAIRAARLSRRSGIINGF